MSATFPTKMDGDDNDSMIPGNGEDEYDSKYCGNDYPDDDIPYGNNSNYDDYREDAIPRW